MNLSEAKELSMGDKIGLTKYPQIGPSEVIGFVNGHVILHNRHSYRPSCLPLTDLHLYSKVDNGVEISEPKKVELAKYEG